MDWAKLVLDYIKVLAWPTTTMILAVYFHKPLTTILARLRKVGLPGGASLDFQEKIQEATELSETVPAFTPPPDKKKIPAIPLTEANARMISLGLQPVSSGLDLQYFRGIAESDPTLALAGLRIEIDTLARNLAVGFNIELKKNESTGALLQRLLFHSAITDTQADLARKILSLCNRAIHGQPVSQLEAQQVIDAAGTLVDYFLAWLSWGFDDHWQPSQLSPNVESHASRR